jgi:hypothetical protein
MKKIVFIILFLNCLSCSSQVFEWATSASVSSGNHIGRDGLGNLYVASNSCVIKLDDSGSIKWQRNIVGADNYLRGVAAIPEGGVYVAGAFGGSVTFGSFTLYSTAGANANMYLVRYDSSGNIDWIKSSISNEDSGVDDLTIDSDGNPIVIGRFIDSLKLDSFVFDAPSTNQVYLAKYSPSGNCIWAKHLQAASFSGGAVGPKVRTDKSGNGYVFGHFIDWIEFDSTHINAHGPYDQDIFLGKFDESGEFLWVKTMGGSSQEILNWMDVDSSGNIYTTGYFSSTPAYFDAFTLNNTSADDYFTAKYDPSGNCSWAKYGYSGVIAACKDGYYTHYPDLVSKFDSLGALLWSKSVGTTVYNNAMIAAEDTVFIAGTFTGTANFDAHALSSAADQMYIAKLSSAPVGTGVEKPLLNSSLSLFPNPGNGLFTISYHSSVPEDLSLRVFNAQGLLVYFRQFQNAGADLSATVDLRGKAAGQYTIELRGERTREVKKVVLQ